MRTLCTLVCCLLLGATSAFAGEATADPAAVGPGPFWVLVEEVRSLRIELWEQRLERYEERIEQLQAELAEIKSDRRRLTDDSDESDREQIELQQQLGDPALDDAGRAYVEAMLESLDMEQSHVLENGDGHLAERERELAARLVELEKRRTALERSLEALRQD